MIIEKIHMDERISAFCGMYAEFGDAEYAAIRAGYPRDKALGEGLRLLEDRTVASKIKQIIKKGKWRDHTAQALTGLRRIALGSRELPSNINTDGLPVGIDAYCVSEIKVTEKGTEVKFFDRIKALEMLIKWDAEKDGNGKGAELYSAVMKSAQAIFRDGTDRIGD